MSTNESAAAARGLAGAVPAAGARPRTVWPALIFATCFIVSALPVLAAHTLPLRDLQAHLSRAALIAASGQASFIGQFYHINFAPTGAFALDLILPMLVRLFGIMLAGKIFVLLTFFMLAGGAAFLNVTLAGRLTWWPLLTFLLLYNLVLTWGFLNYLLGLGLLFWVVGAWLRTESWSWPTRSAVFSLLAYALLICHLYTFALYGACVMSIEIARRRQQFGDIRLWRQRSAWLSLLQFALPVVIFFLTSPTASHTTRLRGGGWSLLVKLYGLVSIVNTGGFWTDLALSFGCYAGFGIALFAGWIRLDRRLAWVLAGLVLCYPIWPDVIFGGGFAAYRLPVAVAFLAVAASVPAPPLLAGSRVALGVVGALIVLQSGLTTARWRNYDRQYATIERLVDQVPTHQRLLFVLPRDNLYYGANDPPLSYAPELAMVSHDIFVNGAFVWPEDNSSISLTPPYAWMGSDRSWRNEYYAPDLAKIRAAPMTDAGSPFRPQVTGAYDYLLIEDAARFGLPPGTYANRMAADGAFELFKLH
jgi:hypothetical protein